VDQDCQTDNQEDMMEITLQQFKRCDVVRVKGRVDSMTAPQLAQALHGIIEEGRFRIVVDMSEVEFVSSAGLRVLLEAQKTCKRWNRGEVVLAALSPTVREAFELTGFTRLFTIYDDVLSAVGAF